MEDGWREFEMLVARIEHVINPLGMVITSPDYVPDLITGEKREVDASIRLSKGAPPIRVLECRDRSKVQDVTWIEQIATKCRDHGIPTTAVSATGFTKSADVKAAHYNIETRKISDVSQDEMTGWTRILDVKHSITRPVVVGVRIVMQALPRDTIDPQLHPTVVEDRDRRNGLAEIFRDKANGQMRSVCSFVDLARHQTPEILKGVPDDGSKIRRTLMLEFEPNLYSVETMDGPRDLSKLTVTLDLHVEKVLSPIPGKGHLYHGTQRPAVQGIETEAEVLGRRVLVSLNKEIGSDKLFVTVTRREKASNERG